MKLYKKHLEHHDIAGVDFSPTYPGPLCYDLDICCDYFGYGFCSGEICFRGLFG